MLLNRHFFAVEPMTLPQPFNEQLLRAMEFEVAGNWSLAGEVYGALRVSFNSVTIDSITKARVGVRAGACFEVSQSHSTSARFYDEAAMDVEAAKNNPHLAAELYNRAALQYREAAEHFYAGTAWIRAAEQFGKIACAVIKCSENIGPLPISAVKSHLCGACFEATAVAYESASGEEVWSVMAYWRAGRAYAEAAPNIQSFNAYRRAIIAHIKYYGTLEDSQLRLSLPLSDSESALNPSRIGTMEAALIRCNNHHQKTPGDTPESRLKTNREMTAVFHAFALELRAIGNSKEAERFRVEQSERERMVLGSEGRCGAALLYGIWKITSNYGESLSRWATVCALVVFLFAVAYAAFGTIGSGSNVPDTSLRGLDYVYFSIITFSALGYGDLHPVTAVGKILACLEVFAGLTMFGILLSFILNRTQRG